MDHVTAYSVCGFLAVFILNGIVSAVWISPTITPKPPLLKTLLRRVLYDGASIGTLVLLAVVADSSGVGEFCLGGYTAFALGWVWSLGVFAIVGLRWVFSNRIAQPTAKTEAEVDEDGDPLPHWQVKEEDDTFKIRFDTMRLRADTYGPGDEDGGYRYDMYKLAKETWRLSLADEGWTEHAWGAHNFDEYELRRSGEAAWSWRLTEKYWNRMAIQAEHQIATGQGWVKRPAERSWTPVPERWAPSIETAYQRYIHQPLPTSVAVRV